MAHATPGRGGGTGDEAGDGLFAVILRPARRFGLGIAADLADHDDGLRFRIFIKHLEHVEVVRAIYRVAANAHAGALAVTTRRELPDGFVRKRAAARDDADVATLVNVAGGNADTAAAVRILASAGRDHAWAVRTDEACLGVAHGGLHADHVIHRNAFSDGDGKGELSVHALEDGIRREGRRHKDCADRGAGFTRSFRDGVEDRHLLTVVLESLSALSRSDTGHKLRAVIERQLCVPRAEV